MKTTPVNFINRAGYQLAGLLDQPSDTTAAAYAVLAHCFTCGKDLKPFVNIAKALTAQGIAVLRFDFAGLGKSAGEFADSNLSTNETDLVDAATFLEQNFSAPSMLIGHSMGGAAVILAARQIPGIHAVVTIAAAADATHLGKKLSLAKRQAKESGDAAVTIGGQKFTLTRQFFDDLERVSVREAVRDLEAALLILHSPRDETVDIENAAWIFQAARHPKSFVSLDGADHLMLDEKDARYAGSVIAAWSNRYIL